MSRTPRTYSCKFFLDGVNFYRFNAKMWHFRQILHEKVAFFYIFNAKNWHFRQILHEKVAFFKDLTQKLAFYGVNFILQKFCPCKKKWQLWGMLVVCCSKWQEQRKTCSRCLLFRPFCPGHQSFYSATSCNNWSEKEPQKAENGRKHRYFPSFSLFY